MIWPGVPLVADTASTAPVSAGPAPAIPGPTSDARQRVVPSRRQATVTALGALPPTGFAADSAELSGAARATVLRVAEVLRADPSVAVSVVGYCADTPGPAEVAQRLSEQRAAVVADALAAAGIARDRLTTVGRGTADPLATPAASRRVEIQVP
jgi:outer membrane protein OmpA-like peptidoglycan-associated protein